MIPPVILVLIFIGLYVIEIFFHFPPLITRTRISLIVRVRHYSTLVLFARAEDTLVSDL